jgi:hypothetical protein
MIFINPQDSSYLAPAIYRSVEAQSQLASPITVREICREDFHRIRALRELRNPESSVVPGFHDVATKEFGAKLAGLNLRVLEVGGEFQYADRSSVSTSSLKVVGAIDEDYIAEKVLRHIGKECRTKVIPKHLRLGRAVFVASTAIQAENFEVAFEWDVKGQVSAKCRLIGWLCGEAEGKATVARKTGRSAKGFVTIGLVPADIRGRQVLAMEDLRPSTDERFQLARAEVPNSRSRVRSSR